MKGKLLTQLHVKELQLKMLGFCTIIYFIYLFIYIFIFW